MLKPTTNPLRDAVWRVNKGKRRSKAGNNWTSTFIPHHMAARKARIYDHRNKRQGTNADLQPSMTYTRQHLKQYYLNKTGATHRHLHKNPKRKGSRDFPVRVVQPWRPQPRAPRRDLRARAARSSRRPPDSSDGVLGKWTGFSGCLVADGVGNGRRSVSLVGPRDCTD